jgi:hypothetical protein
VSEHSRSKILPKRIRCLSRALRRIAIATLPTLSLSSSRKYSSPHEAITAVRKTLINTDSSVPNPPKATSSAVKQIRYKHPALYVTHGHQTVHTPDCLHLSSKLNLECGVSSPEILSGCILFLDTSLLQAAHRPQMPHYSDPLCKCTVSFSARSAVRI